MGNQKTEEWYFTAGIIVGGLFAFVAYCVYKLWCTCYGRNSRQSVLEDSHQSKTPFIQHNSRTESVSIKVEEEPVNYSVFADSLRLR